MMGGMGGSTPQDALMKQLREEDKEKVLKFGMWQRDGYFQQGRDRPSQYQPRLKVKDGSTFQNVGKLGGSFQSAILQRPSILDIDNLFSTKPLVPSMFRPSQVVQADMTYQTMGMGQNPGFNGGMPQHGGMPSHHGGMPNQGYQNQGYQNQGYPNQGYPTQGYPNQGYQNQGYPNQGYNPGMQGGSMGGQCYPSGGNSMGGMIGNMLGG